ncbi:hypothetical protein [Rheinheimera aquimaris]|uniref:hypothetical protein n=1 Tax=Rheinheimera aquimaris TaxID=412437 RepID=UPI003A984129
MKKIFQIALLLVVSFTAYATDSAPSNSEAVKLIDGYNEVLVAANESSIHEQANSSFRVLWLRSFHEPVIFSLSKSNETNVIITKVLDGLGGYEKGKLKSVNSNEVAERHVSYIYQTLAKTCRFYELAVQQPPVSMDGSTIVIELNIDGTYHAVQTQSMRSNECINKIAKLVVVLSGVVFERVY